MRESLLCSDRVSSQLRRAWRQPAAALLDNLGLGNAGMKVAVGIPGQTEETLLRTLRLANRATTQRMELTMVHPQPTRPDEASVARKPTDER